MWGAGPFSHSGGAPRWLSWDPAGELLWGAFDAGVAAWDESSGEERRSFPLGGRRFDGPVWLRDGSLALRRRAPVERGRVTGSGAIDRYDPATGERRATFVPDVVFPGTERRCATWCPYVDGHAMLAVLLERTAPRWGLWVWSLEEDRLVAALDQLVHRRPRRYERVPMKPPYAVLSRRRWLVGFDARGTRREPSWELVIADLDRPPGPRGVTPAPTGHRMRDRATHLVLDASERRLIVTGAAGRVLAWDLERAPRGFELASGSRAVRLDDRGAWMREPEGLVLRDFSTFEVVSTVPLPSADAPVALSPDATRVATVREGVVEVLSTEGGRRLSPTGAARHTGPVAWVAYPRDGLALSASRPNEQRAWDPLAGRSIASTPSGVLTVPGVGDVRVRHGVVIAGDEPIGRLGGADNVAPGNRFATHSYATTQPAGPNLEEEISVVECLGFEGGMRRSWHDVEYGVFDQGRLSTVLRDGRVIERVGAARVVVRSASYGVVTAEHTCVLRRPYFLPGAAWAVDLREPNELVVIDLETFDDIARYTVAPGARVADGTDDGRRLALLYGARVVVLDLDAGARHELAIDDGPTCAAFRADGLELLVGCRTGTVHQLALD